MDDNRKVCLREELKSAWVDLQTHKYIDRETFIKLNVSILPFYANGETPVLTIDCMISEGLDVIACFGFKEKIIIEGKLLNITPEEFASKVLDDLPVLEIMNE